MEDYKKKYEDALERCKKEFNFSNLAYSHEEIKQRLEHVFPELKESEDERIRKEIIKVFTGETGFTTKEEAKKYVAWLEKQSEKTNPYSGISFEYNGHIWGMCARDNGVDILLDKQLFKHLEEQGEMKTADNNESKFKINDWITKDGVTWQVSGIINNNYILLGQDDTTIKEKVSIIDSEFHRWTIGDAVSGDVLVSDETTVIFKSIDIPNTRCFCTWFRVNQNDLLLSTLQNSAAYNPATQEQRDLLFKKMKEAGYEWDAEKKELKKIEQKVDVLPKGEDYGIDSLWHATQILERTIGKVEGYQSDDGILEHRCAIEVVKRLYSQKHIKLTPKRMKR